MSFGPPLRPRAPARNSPAPGSAPSTPSVNGPKSNLSRTPSSSSPRIGAPLGPKRGSPRPTTPRPTSSGGSPERPLSRGSVSASLAREIEEKEVLLGKVHEQDAIISALNAESKNFISALTAAEARMQEMDADQARMEDELATKNEVAEKLRSQIRELEKEKRDLQKRYNEQTQTFESERQSFYDNEQHLKSRIQNLSQSQRSIRTRKSSMTQSIVTERTSDELDHESDSLRGDEEEHEPPEIIAMKLELSTLATSHASLQGTLQLMQAQLADLQRVNKELQEENESYNMLLIERTISGQYDLLRRTTQNTETDDVSSLHGTTSTRSNLEALPEVDEAKHAPTELELALAQPRSISPATSVRTGGRKSRRVGSISSGGERGETLGDLPITGPGLDLAAELGRAENKEYVDQIPDGPKEPEPPLQVDATVVEALRSEVKALKDANKALNLYASKILDRIIAQGGFEHVLAVDYDSKHVPTEKKTAASPKVVQKETKPRTGPNQEPSIAQSDVTAQDSPKSPPPHARRASKRGISIDWGRFWPSGTASAETPVLREPVPPIPDPIKATPTQTARKLDHEDEDEEDRMLRERLKEDMRLHGIEKEFPPREVKSPSPNTAVSSSFPNVGSPEIAISTPTTPTPSFKTGLPFFGPGTSPSSSEAASPSAPLAPLTSEALQQAEARTTLAAFDARERELAEEIAKGRSGGFTEMTSPRPGSSLSQRHRSRRSGGSGHSAKSGASTLFSAGRASMEESLGGSVKDEA
ncbi:uncharacterized protein EI90DRAFT_3040979 [Cantharellus anzutake]|uniref:uncharacterized protein n=1 Tax=Cantharellus anzutake TaxID=1750568 RepID=UPI0019080BF9|nr:uncharacterized protein EI90DRAFT_3040979 [Cantharellus anzutake]KAF8337900.1 hypothetical protein EI90DRAFT_3040979 [Cantharellus anzutake]